MSRFDRETAQKLILESIDRKTGKLDLAALREGIKTFSDTFTKSHAKEWTDYKSYYDTVFDNINYGVREVLGLVPEKQWSGHLVTSTQVAEDLINKTNAAEKTLAQYQAEHRLHITKGPKTYDPDKGLAAQGYEFTAPIEKEKTVAVKPKEKEAHVTAAPSKQKYYAPMEISFFGETPEDKTPQGNIKRADVLTKGFGTSEHPGQRYLNTMERQNNGSYEATSGEQGIVQLDIIEDMQAALKYYKGRDVALIVKGKPVQKLSYEEATAYLGGLHKLHSSRTHALKEMKELISYCAKAGGSIDAEDNAALDAFAKKHGMALDRDMKNGEKAEELVAFLKKKGFVTNERYETDSIEDVLKIAKERGFSFNYKPIENQDSIQIQDLNSGKTLATVKGIKIDTKHSNTR